MLSSGGLGLLVHKNDGFGMTDSGGHKSFFTEIESEYTKCANEPILRSSNKWGAFLRCWQSKPGDPSVILLGDSHAEHLFFGFAESLPDSNVVSYIEGGRPSFEDPEFATILNELTRSSGDGKFVVISTHWIQDFSDGFVNELKDLVRTLKQLHYGIAILGDVPRFNSTPSECIVPRRIKLRSREGDCDLSVGEVTTQANVYEPFLRDVARDENILYLAANHGLICNESLCAMAIQDRLIYRDSHHLTAYGSKLFGGDFVARLKKQGFFW